MDELEASLDTAIYMVCISIRLILKKSEDDTKEKSELESIMHSLLLINELPLIDDPKYMDRCARMFYATISELPMSSNTEIVRLWSNWHRNELDNMVNRSQQYITVIAVSQNLDEMNRDDQDEEDEDVENDFLHKNEGVSGAVGYLRLIYYACILGGRLDTPERIQRERATEAEEMKFIQDSSINSDEVNYEIPITYRLDPLEESLDLRPIDCREPLLPFTRFINEVANQYINIQQVTLNLNFISLFSYFNI
jgi:ubiquitin-protein ligase E3 A